MDGVDCAIVDVRPGRSQLRITLLAHRTRPYPAALREQLLSLYRTGTVAAICRLDAAVGEVFAREANRTIRQAKLSARDIAVIGSHGQTVWHSPTRVPVPGIGSVRSSLQIGDPSVIAERTGIMTVADFRARDLAAGGEGAPLTPYVHYHVFQSRKTSRLIVNLGGIANVTWLPRGGGLEDVVAFDVGPCTCCWTGCWRTPRTGNNRSIGTGPWPLADVRKTCSSTNSCAIRFLPAVLRNPPGVKNSMKTISGMSCRSPRDTAFRWKIRWRRVAPLLRERFTGPGHGWWMR